MKIKTKTKFKKFIELVEPKLPILLIRLIELAIGTRFKSFSFYGEDAILQGILKRYKFIFGKELELSYIDIGGWRPVKGSNTYFLYRQKLYGTVVEPNPYFKNIYTAVRPHDVYLEVGCHVDNQTSLYRFNKSAASNSMDLVFAKSISKDQNVRIQDQITVDCLTLDEIVTSHLKHFSKPFILDIDIEGSDYDVINSFSFKNQLRPCLILIEDWISVGEKIQSSRITLHLENYGYELIGGSVLTSIFVDKKSELFSVFRK